MIQDSFQTYTTRRKESAQSLYNALSFLLSENKPFSEFDLHQRILLEQRKSKDIFPDGWYIPPPNGIAVLFSTDKDFSRSNFISLRYKDFWPRKDIFFDREHGIITAYVSSVDKKTHIIGDFGLTLYFGNDKKVRQHLNDILDIQRQIVSHAKVGMKISDLYKYGEVLFKKKHFANDWWVNVTDPSGRNMGHTIPAAHEEWNKEALGDFKNGSWEKVSKVISNSRVFVSPAVDQKIVPGMILTIEPRLKYNGKTKKPIFWLHTIAAFDTKGNKEFITNFDKLLELSEMKKNNTKKINYEQSGVDYSSLDPAKKLAQDAAKTTAVHLKNYGFRDVADTRGEAAFVWKQKNVYMAQVTESLGTKNLVADAMRKITRKTYYDVIGHDTITTALNDLTSVGAKPLVVTAFWAVGKSSWFDDIERINDLVKGWKSACDIARATWGGGESPSYNDIVNPEVIALGGSVTGIIKSKKNLIVDKNLKAKDRIIFLRSTGINANGLSLARAISKKLPKGYATKLLDGTLFGEAILNKTNIYAELIQALQKAHVNIHYISNITGHGLRKIMRGKPEFTYIIEKLFPPHEVFNFIQKHANLTDEEMYGTYNMGQDYAIFVPQKDVKKTLEIIKKNKFKGMDAGYIKKGPRQVVIQPKNITFDGSRLDLR